jgi:haloalkane dehalogenase
MEAIVRPFAGWHEWNPLATKVFQGFRSDQGEAMVLERNLFIERVLFGSIIRKLTEAEMAEYRRPFVNPSDRWPTLTWPRQIPIAGDPADVARIVQAYSEWLPTASFPKLFINGEPGAILTGAVRDFVRTWKNQTEVRVSGSHFVQEDSGPEIGRAIAEWLRRFG